VNLTTTLNRYSVFFYAFFAVSAVFAFWPGYLSQIFQEPAALVHIHGALMSLWLAMLISQAFLIRSNRRAIHKQIGKLSYVLAPLVLLSMATIRHNAMAETGLPVAEQDLSLLFPNVIGQPLTFALAFGLALYYRHDPGTHARFMLCTPLPMAGPIFNRIMGSYTSLEINFAQATSNAVLILIASLLVWDWLVHRSFKVFPIILTLLISVGVIWSSLAGTAALESFGRWYLALPLS
jgi:hypothetical protein